MLKFFGISAASSAAKFFYSTIFVILIAPFFDDKVIADLFSIIATYTILILVFDFGYSVSLSHRKNYQTQLIYLSKTIISAVAMLSCVVFFFEINVFILFAAAISSIALTGPQISKGELDFKPEMSFYLIQSSSLTVLVTLFLYNQTDVSFAYFITSILLMAVFYNNNISCLIERVPFCASTVKHELKAQSPFWLYTILLHGGNAIELIIASKILPLGEFLSFSYSQRAVILGIFSLPIIYNVMLPLQRRHAMKLDANLYLKILLSSAFLCISSVSATILFYSFNNINAISLISLCFVLLFKFLSAWFGFYILYKSTPLSRAALVSLQVLAVFLVATFFEVKTAEVFMLISSFLLLTFYGTYIVFKNVFS